jgi:hypothetical protein
VVHGDDSYKARQQARPTQQAQAVAGAIGLSP